MSQDENRTLNIEHRPLNWSEVRTSALDGRCFPALKRGWDAWIKTLSKTCNAPLFARNLDLWAFVALLTVFSAPVLWGSFERSMIFNPAAVHAGEWWRFITHPFVHVTWLHLLLDGSAFVLLYWGLAEPRWWRRIGLVIASAAGSLACAWASAPAVGSSGLCGLSGIAHGLMAVSAMEMMAGARDRSSWRWGALTFALVVAKAAIEAFSGHAFFSFLYFGLMGSPVAVSHAGGIIGALACWLVLNPRTRSETAAGSSRTSQ